MIIDANWSPPPMLRQLPPQASLRLTCTACGVTRSESVRDLTEGRRLGAQYLDLFEQQARCLRPGCGRAVRLTCDGVKTERPPLAAPVSRPQGLSQLRLFADQI